MAGAWRYVDCFRVALRGFGHVYVENAILVTGAGGTGIEFDGQSELLLKFAALNTTPDLAGIGWQLRLGLPANGNDVAVNRDLDTLRLRSSDWIVNIVAVRSLIEIKWLCKATHQFAEMMWTKRQGLVHEAIDVAPGPGHQFFHR